jgi:PPIC-type PPIASE domain
MSKKNADREKEEEKDLDEDDEEESDEDEEEEKKPAASARSVDARKVRARAPRPRDDHDDHDHDEDEESHEDDPYWWTPHAVMGVLVLAGVLGFFGVFNKALGGLAGKPSAATEPKAVTATAVKPAEQRDEFGAKHLLVQYKGSQRAGASITRTDEEAKARATEALKKIKGGAKFETIVSEYSDEPGAGARGGDLGKFRRGRMDPQFQAAVEKLKVGEVSDLVKTGFGYHVILRTE